MENKELKVHWKSADFDVEWEWHLVIHWFMSLSVQFLSHSDSIEFDFLTAFLVFLTHLKWIFVLSSSCLFTALTCNWVTTIQQTTRDAEQNYSAQELSSKSQSAKEDDKYFVFQFSHFFGRLSRTKEAFVFSLSSLLKFSSKGQSANQRHTTSVILACDE